MKKSPEITDATRNKFIQTFCELYSEKPISKITVKELTDRAGYNRSTFYQYFGDVYALLEYMEDEMIATGMEKLTSLNLEAPDFNQQFVLTFSQVLQEHEHYSVLLLRSGAGSDFCRKIGCHIIPVMKQRYHVSEDNKKAEFAMEFCLTGMITIMTRWLKNKDELSIEELGSLIHGIWADGLLAQLAE